HCPLNRFISFSFRFHLFLLHTFDIVMMRYVCFHVCNKQDEQKCRVDVKCLWYEGDGDASLPFHADGPSYDKTSQRPLAIRAVQLFDLSTRGTIFTHAPGQCMGIG